MIILELHLILMPYDILNIYVYRCNNKQKVFVTVFKLFYMNMNFTNLIIKRNETIYIMPIIVDKKYYSEANTDIKETDTPNIRLSTRKHA